MDPRAVLQGDPLVVLLVEDDEAHAELVLRSMRSQRVANIIYHVSDGQQALDFLYHRGEHQSAAKNPRPNLILLDLRLPRIDGMEVLKIIKESPDLHRIPVVILTSSAAEIDIARSYEYHANSYVVKPLDFESFSKMMGDLGFYWLGWNAPQVFD